MSLKKSNQKAKGFLSVRLINSFEKSIGSEKLETLTLEEVASFTDKDFKGFTRIGEGGYWELNRILVKKGFPPYNFKYRR